jgi:hypothetical protein
MFFKGSDRAAGWRDTKPRTLSEAAALAFSQVQAEGLPLFKARKVDATWLRRTMLQTIPVYGTHASTDRPQRVGENADTLQLATASDMLLGKPDYGPVWRDLFVTREGYEHYLTWLRSIW